MNNVECVTISVVSHGQGQLIKKLFLSLNNFKFQKIILTINIPEDEEYIKSSNYDITIIRNITPLGFGANHNNAFKLCKSNFFLVLNPDIEINCNFDFNNLINIFDGSLFPVGAVAPLALNENGDYEDNARISPNIFRLFLRFIRLPQQEYCIANSDMLNVDWLAGMFILFKSSVYERVSGFNESYFMYYEDADICRKIRRMCYKNLLITNSFIIHNARRSSRINLKYLFWHISSALRYIYSN